MDVAIIVVVQFYYDSEELGVSVTGTEVWDKLKIYEPQSKKGLVLLCSII